MEIYEDNTFDPTGWQLCANLTQPTASATLLTDPENGDLILLGGEFNDGSGSGPYDSIYRLSDINGQWIKQEKTLEVNRHSHSSIFVPVSQLPCTIN